MLSKYETPTQGGIKNNLKSFHSITRKSYSFQVAYQSDLQAIIQYLDMVTFRPFIEYNSILSVIHKNSKKVESLWHMIGLIDVSIGLLNYEIMHPNLVHPTFQEEMHVIAHDVMHPLLTKPVGNSVDWNQNTLVTGSIVSGKSTYVKAIAVNAILAQTLGFCLASSFICPYSNALTSMSLKDDVLAGDSYFVAEIKSIQRIVKKVERNTHCLCFIDEILRGTNTIERISASSALMNWLQKFSSIIMIATHDIELTEILENQCVSIHFQEFVTNNCKVEFDYKV